MLPFTKPIGDDQTKTLAFVRPIMNRLRVFPAVLQGFCVSHASACSEVFQF